MNNVIGSNQPETPEIVKDAVEKWATSHDMILPV
jgi:hypothetical protein